LAGICLSLTWTARTFLAKLDHERIPILCKQTGNPVPIRREWRGTLFPAGDQSKCNIPPQSSEKYVPKICRISNWRRTSQSGFD